MSVATSTAPAAIRFKDRYWVKTLKWHLYKRYLGKPHWKTRFLFDTRVRLLNSDDLVIDCGANLGEFSRILAAGGATVHAFEPDPYTYSRLLENTSDLPNVICHNCAVGASNGKVSLFRKHDFDADPDGASISSSIFADKVNVDENNSVEVDIIDLREFIDGLGRQVSLLKVDIEGAEVDLMEQMIQSGTIDRCDMIFVETHETRIPSLAERTAALRELSESNRYAKKLYFDWA